MQFTWYPNSKPQARNKCNLKWWPTKGKYDIYHLKTVLLKLYCIWDKKQIGIQTVKYLECH